MADKPNKTSDQLKVVCKHLEDISRSLRILAGREDPLDKVIKPKTYADSYFARSERKE